MGRPAGRGRGAVFAAASTSALLALSTLLLAACSSGVSGSPRASQNGHGSTPQPSMNLLYAGAGIAVATESFASCQGCADQLYVTQDFLKWRDLTPTPPDGSSYMIFTGADFLDPQRGWVLGWDPANLDLFLFHTSDGGFTWTSSSAGTQGDHAGDTTTFHMFDSEHGVLVSTELYPENKLTIESTDDGGYTWTAATSPNSLGSTALVAMENSTLGTATAGFAACPSPPGFRESYLEHTADGGATWSKAHYSLAAGMEKLSTTCSASGTGGLISFGPARFTGGDSAIVPILEVGSTLPTSGSATATLGFDATSDAGATWSARSSRQVAVEVLKQPDASAPAVVFPDVSIVSQSTWWLANPSGNGTGSIEVTTDSGKHWTAVSESGLPAGRAQLTALGASTVFAEFPAIFGSSGPGRLFLTTDEGGSWLQVQPWK